MARIKSRGRPRQNGAPLQWTDDMTLALFQCRYEAFAAPAQRGSWREVAARVGAAFGVELDVDQCRNKVKSAKKRCAQFLADHPPNAPVPRIVAIVRQFCGDSTGEHDEELEHEEEANNDPPAMTNGETTTTRGRVEEEEVIHATPLVAPSVKPEGAATVNSLFVSPVASAKKRGRPTRSGEGALQWTDPLTERLLHARFGGGAARAGESSSGQGKGTQRVMWGAIAARLSEETGLRIEPEQCKNKMKVLTARWTQYLASVKANGDVREAEPPWAHVMRLYWSDGVTSAPVCPPPQEAQQTAVAVPPVTTDAVVEKEDDNAAFEGDDDSTAERESVKRRRAAKSSKAIRWSDVMTEKLFRLRFETLRGDFEANRNSHHVRHAWEVLAQQLSLEFGNSADLTVDQCKSKIHSMKVRWDQYNEALSSGIISPPAVDPEWVRIIKRYCNDGGGIDLGGGEGADGELLASPAPWVAGQRSPEPPHAAPPSPSPSNGVDLTIHQQSSNESGKHAETSAPDSNSGSAAATAVDAPVLAQILHAIHEQRDAALQQTRVIQELLDFLREERHGRSWQA